MIFVVYKIDENEGSARFENLEVALNFVTQNSVGKYFFHTDDGVSNLSSIVRGLVLADAPISISKLLYRQITRN